MVLAHTNLLCETCDYRIHKFYLFQLQLETGDNQTSSSLLYNLVYYATL